MKIESMNFRELKISIHAPREGSDISGGLMLYYKHKISIHAPREGSDGLVGGFSPYAV